MQHVHRVSHAFVSHMIQFIIDIVLILQLFAHLLVPMVVFVQSPEDAYVHQAGLVNHVKHVRILLVSLRQSQSRQYEIFSR